MRIDASEIKEFRTCKRKWSYSSRNKMHLTTIETPPALFFGTHFHECLHMMYKGTELSDIFLYIDKQIEDIQQNRILKNMIGKYYQIALADLDQYDILVIEHGWSYPFTGNITVCGSIDMIALDKQTGLIYGFEHKSGKNFKDGVDLMLDEQTRMYSRAMNLFVMLYNLQNDTQYKFGGIYLNEIRKLVKQFDHRRTLLNHTKEDLERFFNGIEKTAKRIVECSESENTPDPEPSFMKCRMCQFAPVCETYGYIAPTTSEILTKLPDQFKVRDIDHLDEKSKQYGEE